MKKHFILLPQPRHIAVMEGSFSATLKSAIQIKAEEHQELLFTAEQLANTLQSQWGNQWPLTNSKSLPQGRKALTLTLDPHLQIHPQGYQILIQPDQIEVLGMNPQGVFYGAQTLQQIIRQSQGKHLPCLEILDWPDFPTRGVMLDISRDKVPKMETLFMLVDELASWKINQLQLYMEHTFAYRGHEEVWKDASPMTPEDILKLDRYCAERFIELVPNQNSLGHMTRWLRHPTYQHLAETTDAVQTPWGHVQEEPFSLAPVLPQTLDFIKGLYDQLLPNFSSKQINIGCDEAFDIGAGKSKTAVEAHGKGQVYLDYLLALHRDLRRRGYRMQFWGDIILEHPELISQLPEDVIALDWGYEGDHPFTAETKRFKDSGVPFIVCPGTSTWNSLGGRVSNMLENCLTAAQAGLKNNASGYLNTDWGDNGHWQQFPISYPGFAAGAAFSWCLESNKKLNLESILNKVVFRDQSGEIGKILIEIGEEYQRWGLKLPNSSPLFWLLQECSDALKKYFLSDLKPVRESLIRLKSCLDQLDRIRLIRKDAQILKNELQLTINLMIHACKRALTIFGSNEKPDSNDMLYEITDLIKEYQAAWLARNRIGGLADSLKRFDVLLQAYQASDEKG